MAQNNENTEQSCAAVTLCSGGCGFFGSSQFAGMCSKCYKDALKRKQATNPPQEHAGRASPISVAALSAAASSYLSSIETGTPTVTVPKPSASESSAYPSNTDSTAVAPSTSTDDQPAASAACSSAAAGSSASPANTQEPSTLDDQPATPSSETKTKKRNRCSSCKKKVGLTGFECRCGGLYCSMHRYSDKHDCQFDYKKEGEELIRKNNPVVVGAKLQKI